MAIHFKKVTYRNFLSTGDTPTTIYLDRVPSVLITGQNGAGKSTILDAITYGLYGKPYRNINKPQLVNTVNEKNMVVELEFVINSTPYRVIRGIKPGVFEIYRNEVLIQHDAAAKEYQNRLEDILGLNFKAFTQIVILGSARYQSFMDLSSNDRRTIIEEILDITVFSKMNSVLKTHIQTTDINMRDNDYQKDIVQTKIDGQKSLISSINNRAKESKSKIESEKARISLEIDDLSLKVEKLDAQIESTLSPDVNSLHDKLTSAKMKGSELMNKEKQIKDKIEFYQHNDECDVCKQEISEDVKNIQLEVLSKENSQIEKVKPLISETYTSIQNKISEANETLQFIRELESERRDHANKIKTLTTLKNNMVSKESKANDSELEEAKMVLEQLDEDRKTLEREAILLLEEKHNQDICKVLLKDDGIKAKIIKQYLPVMNSLINKFLDRMGANYSFTLDESFNEVIKSRYRDNFSYSSFSEGEKGRINIALLLTWREVAKIKNSAVSNLLILDEVGDSSMDGEGTDILWEILGEMNDTNIFVISHRSSNVDKFTSHLEVRKEGNFSKIINSK